MSFHALKKSISSAQDAADQYKSELMVLINYATQCKAYALPQLNQPPAWYAQAQSTWADTTGKLSGWAMSTLQTLVAQPTYLIGTSTQIVLPTLTEAINDARSLVANPGSNTLRNDLMVSLGVLANRFTQFSSTTDALVQSLQNQANVFDQDAGVMNALATQALNQAGVDQGMVNALNADIQQLQNDIKAQIAVIVGGSVATVAGLAMGGLAIGLAWATGGISLFLMVPAVLITAGGIYAITTAAIQIENDKSKIAKDQNNITQLTADVTMLKAMQSTLAGFAGQVDTLKTALSVVVAPWQAAETYFNATISSLDSIENATSQNWQTVVDELTDIQSQWNGLMTTMQTLEMDANVSTAQINFGMTDSQIKQAVQTSNKVSLVQYLSS